MRNESSVSSGSLKEYLLVRLPLILMLVMDLLLLAAWWGENHFRQVLDQEVMKNLAQKADLTSSVIRDRLLAGDTESAIMTSRPPNCGRPTQRQCGFRALRTISFARWPDSSARSIPGRSTAGIPAR